MKNSTRSLKNPFGRAAKKSNHGRRDTATLDPSRKKLQKQLQKQSLQKQSSQKRLQPLVDLSAWKVLHRKTPYLAQAVFHLLEAGQPMSDVIQAIRSSCTDPSLRPFLACAVYGCDQLRSADRAALFEDPLLSKEPVGLIH